MSYNVHLGDFEGRSGCGKGENASNEFAQMIKWILPPGKERFYEITQARCKIEKTKKQIVKITPAEYMQGKSIGRCCCIEQKQKGFN